MLRNNCFRRLILALFVPMLFFWVFAAKGSAYEENPGEGVTVQPARAFWTTGYILEAIYSNALEDLGYDVRHYMELSNQIFYKAVANGDVDFWANGWFPLHNESLPDNFEKEASTVGYVVKRGALQGYLASRDAVEKYNIKSIADFKREEVRKAFDANGDGKADLVACHWGMGCEKVISHHFDYYNMGEYINPIKSSYSDTMAKAIIRYRNGEPIFFYTWTPNWTVYKLRPGKDVMWINVPKIKTTPGQKGLEGAMVASGVEGAVTDPVKMGFVANDIRVVANDEFLEENPAAKKLFEVMSVPLADIAAQNAKMFQGEDSQEDIERHADQWIKDHKKQWELWLGEVRAAAK